MDSNRRSLAAVMIVGLAMAFLVTSCAPTGEPGAGDEPSPAGESPRPEPAPPASSPGDGAQPSPGRPTPVGQLTVPTSGWRTDFSIASVDLSEIISGGPGKDGIPAIDEPQFEDITAARSWLDDRVPVIALELGGEARAYPIAILIWHEIVNDTVGGVPVVVTFCPLCNTALVFERELDGVVYDFRTTGNLRFSDLVMYDRQTESWWQQATGEAIVGALTGSRLSFVPAQMIGLGEFAETHPDGMVLSRETGHRRDYGRNPYAGYDSIDQQPFLFRGDVDGRLAAMERVAAVTVGGEAVAYPYSELAEVGVVHDVVGGEDVVVFWEPGVASALDDALIEAGRDVGATGVFRPIVDGRELAFERSAEGGITDLQTGSQWSITGRATGGEMAGEQLERIPHGDHFWFAWAAFEPDTRIWTVGP